MNRTASIALAAILVAAMVTIPLAAASVVSTDESANDDGTDSVEPGAQLSASIGVQNAEIDGTVSERALSARLAAAETDEAKAAVLDDHVRRSEDRLGELESRLETLNESREAGDLDEGRYRAEVATLVAEARTIERQAAVAEAAATELPEGAIADRDVESIRTLRDDAGELGGSDTAAVARSIAGDEIGNAFGPDRAPAGPPDTPGENATDERGAGDEIAPGNETDDPPAPSLQPHRSR